MASSCSLRPRLTHTVSVRAQATQTPARTRFVLRICVDPQCKLAGALQIAQFVRDLGLEEVQVRERKCLGDCGFGPNMQLLPQDKGAMGERLNRVSSPSIMAEALRKHCGVSVDPAVVQATELRLAGNLAARQGDPKRAAALFTQGLQQPTSVGRHLLLSNRSSMRLAMGEAEGALEDACAAVECAPPDYTTASMRQVDALLQLGRPAEAAHALAAAAERCPGFGRSAEYEAVIAQVQAATK